MTIVPAATTLADRWRHRMTALPRLLAGSLAVLLLALALNGTLTLGALRTVYTDNLASSVRVVGHDWALRIQGAIRFGKPIEQFFGLDQSLLEISRDLPFTSLVALTLPDGRILGAAGQDANGPITSAHQAAVAEAVVAHLENPRASGSSAMGAADQMRFVFPIQSAQGATAGALVIAVHQTTLDTALAPHRDRNLMVLAATAAGGIFVLAVGLFILSPLRPGLPFRRWRLLLLPVIVLAGTQGLYSWDSIRNFDAQYRVAATRTAGLIAHRLERDLERLFDKGVAIQRLAGIDKPFVRAMAQMPEVSFISVTDADGQGLYRVYRDGRLEQDAAVLPADSTLDTEVTLDRRDGTGTTAVGTLRVRLSAEAIAGGVRQRMLDAGTVVLMSALFVVELLILLAVLLRGRMVQHTTVVDSQAADAATRHILGRPGAFLLVFAWALPLSFIPLRMREINEPFLGLPAELVLAMPISAEMLCALVTALIAGAVMDKRGWHVPFLAGIALSLVGGLLSAVTEHAMTFVLARAVVGLGYGLAWMGIQGFIFHWATPDSRARGLANLVAGIFAGHICGSAVGAILAQQTGFAPVFMASAILAAAPGLFAILFMRPYMTRPSGDGGSSRAFSLRDVRRLLSDRNFSWLLIGSVVPFSIAQVGLLYYTLPIYLSEQGVNQSNIGRVMMIYGLSVIYMGPWIGRYVDRFPNKKAFIVAGGFIGGAGMAYLYFDNSMTAVIASVFLLGLASSLAGAAQSAFALKLPVIQEQGVGKAMGVQRAADKLGQMLGPLVVGLLFTTVGTESGLALTGLLYLVATLAFLVIAREAAPDAATART